MDGNGIFVKHNFRIAQDFPSSRNNNRQMPEAGSCIVRAGIAGSKEWDFTVGRVLVRVFSIATAFFALAAPSAHAFFDPPWITPAAPRVGEIVSVTIREGICDAIVEHPGFPQITQQGNAIRILEYGHHWDDVDLCIYNVGTLTQPIGTFAEGSYTLTVDFVYPDILGPTTITLGTVPFDVSGVVTATPVPTLTVLGRLALPILLFGAAICALRRVRAKF
jgi:hypothetical protein